MNLILQELHCTTPFGNGGAGSVGAALDCALTAGSAVTIGLFNLVRTLVVNAANSR